MHSLTTTFVRCLVIVIVYVTGLLMCLFVFDWLVRRAFNAAAGSQSAPSR